MFSFKYKLTFLIASIILALSVGIFVILRAQIEAKAIKNIKRDFTITKAMVSSLMEDRLTRLNEIAAGLSGNELIRVILTDETLDKVTCDDIVENEILTKYPKLSMLYVANADGKGLAINRASKDLGYLLPRQNFYRASLEGRPGAGFLIHRNRSIQIMAFPLTIGMADFEEVIGIIVVGLTWSKEDLARIKAVSQADLAFFQKNEIILSTDLQLINDRYSPKQVFATFLNNASNRSSFAEPAVVPISNERFLHLSIWDDSEVLPPYIIAKSLDRQLAFVKKLEQIITHFGAGGIAVGLLVSFLLALSVSRPIDALRAGTLEVERGNYKHRVNIKTRDEFSQLSKAFNQMVQGLSEKERIRGVMNKVVSTEIADEILKSELQLGGEERTATILFSDIRGFTTLSEGLNPVELLDLLNAYFTKVSGCIDAHRGNIDKYLGDAIMALFGVPVTRNCDAKDAILAALDMIEALNEFNRTLEKERGRAIRVGVGINTGPLVAGLMGASNRMEYTVLGDEVNLAARLEGLTKQYGVQIIISESSFNSLQECLEPNADPEIKVRELDVVQVKGKSSPIKIYQVFTRDELSDRLDSFIEQFQVARELLKARQFGQSMQALTALSADWPADAATRVFRARVDTYMKNPAIYEKEYHGGVYICSEK